MSVDITNHLVPWVQVKQWLRNAWAEGFVEGHEYTEDNNDWANEFGPLPTIPGNPYEGNA